MWRQLVLLAVVQSSRALVPHQPRACFHSHHRQASTWHSTPTTSTTCLHVPQMSLFGSSSVVIQEHNNNNFVPAAISSCPTTTTPTAPSFRQRCRKSLQASAAAAAMLLRAGGARADELAVSFDRPVVDVIAPKSNFLGAAKRWLPGLVVAWVVWNFAQIVVSEQGDELELEGQSFEAFDDGGEEAGEKGPMEQVQPPLAPSLPFVKSLAGFLAFFTSEPVRYQLRLLQSRLAGVVESVKAARQWVMPVQQEVLSSGDWVECTLTGKQPLGDSRCTRYSFQFGTARQTFGLQLGQALSLLGIDTESKTTHRIEVIPSSQRGTAGSFEIVLKDASELAPVSMRLPSASTDSNVFAFMLERMEIGDQIAAKPGTNQLTYRGETPITDVLVVANGVGVAPTLQLVRELLPGSSSSVERASMVYVNKRQEEFINVKEVEAVWFKHSKKLDVSCVLDEDPESADLWRNEAFRASVPSQHRPGTMVVVAGTVDFKEQVAAHLISLGYPEEAIVKL